MVRSTARILCVEYVGSVKLACHISIGLLGLSVLGGCSVVPIQADLGSLSAKERMLGVDVAVKQSLQTGEELSDETFGALILMLGSDDPAERLYAIGRLDRLTGERLGYDPTADAQVRSKAQDRWRDWLEQRVNSQD